MKSTHFFAVTIALLLPIGALNAHEGEHGHSHDDGKEFAGLPLPDSAVAATPSHATGTVFNDRNGNERRDAGEPGIPNIRVSNQHTVVRTDKNGRYRLPVDEETTLFVVKPRGWRTPIDEVQLPRFYYHHRPKGSPPNMKYPGVLPTGPLPASVNFPLYPQKEPDRFRAVIFADPQPRNNKEVEFVGHDVIEELIGIDAAFGVSLGDIAFDDLNTFQTLNQKIALIGIPWYNVMGNHDLNFDSPNDKHSDETFEATYGPNYYSFDYGPTHFMVLDDMTWYGAKPGAARGYFIGEIGAAQLEWIKNDLAQIPKNQMVVLMMHVPLVNNQGKFEGGGNDVQDRTALYRLIEKRPFCISISGHTHYQEHKFITKEDGWMGIQPHHHTINVTVSGSWWSGLPDEKGIPHTTMRDGAPNGYSFLNFDGNKYWFDFKAARRPAEHQMNIFTPETIAASDATKTEIVVNVFTGSEKSKVEMRFGDKGAWLPMQRVNREDPYFALLKEREAIMLKGKKRLEPVLGYALPAPVKTPHLWVANLPANPALGTHLIQVRATDMFGRTFTDQRIIRVVDTLPAPPPALAPAAPIAPPTVKPVPVPAPIPQNDISNVPNPVAPAEAPATEAMPVL